MGDEQVVWEGVQGFVDRAYYTNFWHPMPRHAWADLSAAELLTAEVSTRSPLGWGPFAMHVWVAGDSIVLKRNPFYFRASDGLPRVDEVTFRFIRDTDELISHLTAGTCDVVSHEAAAALELDELVAQPGVVAHTAPANTWELLAFGITPVRDLDRPDVFEDVRVRRGIAQCIDRQTLVDEAVGSGGRVLHSYVPPEHPAYAGEQLTAWAHDAEAGQRLLAEAGWYDEDGDGVREAHSVPEIPDGTPYRVTCKTADDPMRVSTARLIKDQLSACGISVTVQIEPVQMLFGPGPEGSLFGRRFDLAQFSWQLAPEPLCDAFLSSQMPGQGDWNRPNVAGFIDARFDAACEEALETLPGSADYLAAQGPPQRIFSEQLPVLPLYQHQKTTLTQSNVSGLSPNASQPSELWNLEEIDVQW